MGNFREELQLSLRKCSPSTRLKLFELSGRHLYLPTFEICYNYKFNRFVDGRKVSQILVDSFYWSCLFGDLRIAQLIIDESLLKTESLAIKIEQLLNPQSPPPQLYQLPHFAAINVEPKPVTSELIEFLLTLPKQSAKALSHILGWKLSHCQSEDDAHDMIVRIINHPLMDTARISDLLIIHVDYREFILAQFRDNGDRLTSVYLSLLRKNGDDIILRRIIEIQNFPSASLKSVIRSTYERRPHLMDFFMECLKVEPEYLPELIYVMIDVGQLQDRFICQLQWDPSIIEIMLDIHRGAIPDLSSDLASEFVDIMLYISYRDIIARRLLSHSHLSSKGFGKYFLLQVRRRHTDMVEHIISEYLYRIDISLIEEAQILCGDDDGPVSQLLDFQLE
jgi:hypothetical protein